MHKTLKSLVLYCDAFMRQVDLVEFRNRPWMIAGGTSLTGERQRQSNELLTLLRSALNLSNGTSTPPVASTDIQQIPIAQEAGRVEVIRLTKILREWGAGLSKPEAIPQQSRQTRTGRPRNGESDKGALVLAALTVHHQYEQGGSVGNHEPASVRGLAEANPPMTSASVSRFLKSKFKAGHKAYSAACRRGEIGRFLATWQGDVSEGHVDLQENRHGRSDDCDDLLDE